MMIWKESEGNVKTTEDNGKKKTNTHNNTHRMIIDKYMSATYKGENLLTLNPAR